MLNDEHEAINISISWLLIRGVYGYIENVESSIFIPPDSALSK